MEGIELHQPQLLSRAQEAPSGTVGHGMESPVTWLYPIGMRTEARPDLRILSLRGIKSSAPPDHGDLSYPCATLILLGMLM